jgi:hypothetical protein
VLSQAFTQDSNVVVAARVTDIVGGLCGFVVIAFFVRLWHADVPRNDFPQLVYRIWELWVKVRLLKLQVAFFSLISFIVLVVGLTGAGFSTSNLPSAFFAPDIAVVTPPGPPEVANLGQTLDTTAGLGTIASVTVQSVRYPYPSYDPSTGSGMLLRLRVCAGSYAYPWSSSVFRSLLHFESGDRNYGEFASEFYYGPQLRSPELFFSSIAAGQCTSSFVDATLAARLKGRHFVDFTGRHLPDLAVDNFYLRRL